MDPIVWGKHGWIFLHSITMAYPDKPTAQEKQKFMDFFMLLPDVLPCSARKQHLKEHMCQYSLRDALHSKTTLVEWLINIHNLTNKTLGKPTKTFEQVIQLYKSMYSNTNTEVELFSNPTSGGGNTVVSSVLGACVILLLFYIWKKRSILFYS